MSDQQVTQQGDVISVEDATARLEKIAGRNGLRTFGLPPYDPDRETETPFAGLAEAAVIPKTIKRTSAAGQETDEPTTVRVVARESVTALKRDHPLARRIETVVPTGASSGAFAEALRTAARPMFRERADLLLVGSEAARTALREDGFASDLDHQLGTLSRGPEQEFLQILGGPYSKQLYLSAYLEMHAKCFWELHHNPIAQAFVSVFTDAVVGRGVRFKAKDAKFQAFHDQWEKRDRFQWRLRKTQHDLTWQGEILWRRFVAPDGMSKIRLLDPSTIWEVIADPADTEQVHGYWQQYPGPYNIYTMQVRGQWVPQAEYIIRLIPAADVLHVKVNEAYGEKRGRSDFFPVLAWFKRFRDFMAARVTSAMHERAFVWDVQVTGDLADVVAALSNQDITKVPQPGQAWWHNDGIKVTPMSAKVGGQGDAPSGTALDLVRTICAGLNFPVEYMNWGGSGSSKAQAIVGTAPWPVRVQNRQLLLETELLIPNDEAMFRTAQAFGLDVGRTWEGEYTWPEPVREDIDARMNRLATLVDSSVISHKTYAVMQAGEANITNYDYEAEQKQIAAEKAQRVAAGTAALDGGAASVAASRLTGQRPMSPGDRAGYKDDASSLRPSQPEAPDPDEDAEPGP